MTRAASALLLATFALTFLGGPWGDERVSDLFLYRSHAAGFLDGALPYRDVALTLVEFPARYADVVAREPAWLWPVAVRNVLLLAVLGLALRALLVSPLDATAGAAARLRWRGRHPRPRSAPR